MPREPEEIGSPLEETTLDPNPGAPADAVAPLVFIPVEAADVLRRRRRRWTVVVALLLIAVATAAFLYKRSTDPLRAQESYDAGVRLLKIARYPQAILNFDRVTSLQPNFAEAYLMRGRALIADNQSERGSRDLSKYIQLRPRDPVGLLDRGAAYMEMHDYQSAIADADSAIEVDPNLAAGYMLRGTAVRAMGNPRGALKDLDRAVQLAPVEINYFERASTYQILGEHQLAIADLNELIAFRPDFAPGFFARAKSRTALGDFKGAREDREAGRILDGRE